jgi:hypothetical protein
MPNIFMHPDTAHSASFSAASPHETEQTVQTSLKLPKVDASTLCTVNVRKAQRLNIKS